MNLLRGLLLFAGLALLLSTSHRAAGQRFAWTQTQQHATFGRSSATNNAGYTLVGATFTDSLVTSGGITRGVTWFPGLNPRTGATGAAMLLYDPAGNLLRTTPLDNAAHDWQILSCALDENNNAYLSLSTQDTIRDGNNVLRLASKSLVHKYDAAGQLVWARKVTGGFTATQFRGGQVWALALDAAANLYFAGQGFQQDSVAGMAVDTVGPVLVFAGSYSPTGQPRWVQQIRTPAAPQPPFTGASLNYMRVSPAGDCALTGYAAANTTTYFGAGPGAPSVTVVGGQLMYVVRYTASGAFTSVRHVEGSYMQPFFSAALPDGSDTYLTGFSFEPFTFQGQAFARGLFVSKLNAAGQVLWLQQPLDTATRAPVASITNDLALDAQGRLYVIGQPVEAMPFGGLWLDKTPFVAQLAPTTGTPQWAVSLPPGAGYLAAAQLCAAGPDVYLTGYLGDHAPWAVGHSTVHGWGTFVVKISPDVNRLTGRAYLDANANNQLDPGEGAFPRSVSVVETGLNQYATTHPTTGRFTAYANQGAYDLRLPQVPRHYQLTQGAAGHQAVFSGLAQLDSARHFGLKPVPNQQDLRVSLTAFRPLRRGIPTRYRIRVENVGTTLVPGGQATVQLAAAATLVGTMPAATTVQGNTISWNFQALGPFGTRDYDLTLNLPLNVLLGEVLVSSATVAATAGFDVTPTDNVDVLSQTVIGSFDPNDISVSYDTLTRTQVAAGTPLDYVVRFENIGTDTAFAVLIQDSLPAGLLQLSTLDLVSQSHSVEWSLSGPGLLTLRFPGIKLPHRAVDAVRAQGFVRFRIVPRATLGPGTVIPNAAHITFDFNSPLATNAATTLVLGVTGLPREAPLPPLHLAPNPAAGRTTLTANLPTGGPTTVRVFDALGRPVRHQTFAAPAGPLCYLLETGGLPAGLYTVRLMLPGGGTASQRLVVAASRE